MTVTPVCIVNFDVGTITRCLTHLISMLVHTEWLFWALLSLCHAFLGCVCVCEWERYFHPYYSFPLTVILVAPCASASLSEVQVLDNLSMTNITEELMTYGRRAWDWHQYVFSWWLSLRWKNFFLESVMRFCFHITSLMLSRLYTIREDYLNVSNVDLYYINNSQVYVGFSFFKIHFWYCEKSFVQKD